MSLLRRFRAIVTNGLVWGGAWFVGVLGLTAIASIFSSPGTEGWREAFELAAQGGVLFGIAGAAFSTVITLAFRGRRLADISWVRFGIGGAVVSALFVPTFMSVMRFVSGDDMLPFSKLLTSGVLGLIVGGIAAAGTLKLAQLADRMLPGTRAGEPELLEGDRSVPSVQPDRQRAAESQGSSRP